MAYTVVIDGVPILCDSAADALALARQAASVEGAFVPSSSALYPPILRAISEPLGPSRWTEQRIRDFFRHIKPQQRKLVEALLETSDARTDEQLCQLLGLADGRALAGVFTGLFKNAKKVGADPKEIYIRHSVTINDRRQFEYTLAEGFRAAAKKWRG